MTRMSHQPSDHAGPRLLQVFNQYIEPGGEEVWVNQMLRLGGDSFDIQDLRFHSGAWIGRGAPLKLKQAALLWNHPAARNRLRECVAQTHPDLLLFHNLVPVASLGMYEEARLLERPVVQYVHNFRPFSPSGTMLLRGKVNPAALRGNPWPEVLGRAWERSFLRSFLLAIYQNRLRSNGSLDIVKHWIAVSDFMRDRFIEAGIPAERITTLRHCWEARPLRERVAEGKHYLFLGRLVPEKGIDTLLLAWSLLEKRMGTSCPQLIIAGSGPKEARIHARANNMRRVACIGYVSGSLKDDLLRGCRGLIAPSIWWEPLGLIVHEAYDAARPVLAARSGGLTETVTHGVTGYLHDPGNAEQLARDVEQLEELGSNSRADMGNHGRQWLLKHATPGEWRDRFVTIVKAAMG